MDTIRLLDTAKAGSLDESQEQDLQSRLKRFPFLPQLHFVKALEAKGTDKYDKLLKRAAMYAPNPAVFERVMEEDYPLTWPDTTGLAVPSGGSKAPDKPKAKPEPETKAEAQPDLTQSESPSGQPADEVAPTTAVADAKAPEEVSTEAPTENKSYTDKRGPAEKVESPTHVMNEGRTYIEPMPDPHEGLENDESIGQASAKTQRDMQSPTGGAEFPAAIPDPSDASKAEVQAPSAADADPTQD
ncbi:MAG: hypothetical protein ACOCZ8_01435, partial [Bacteroidota bacterium]